MAKGDDKRARNQSDYQGELSQNHLNNLRNDMIIPQAQTAQNNFTNASQRGWEDYNKIGGQYQNWADTGGLSAMDKGNIRSRALSPIRSLYSSANRDVDRQKALQGGYSPGYGALKSRLAREMSSGLSDATTNAEGMIAGMVNQGKQFGMQGMSSLYGQAPGMAQMYGGLNDSAMNRWMGTEQMQQNLGQNRVQNQIDAGKMPGRYEHTMGRIKDVGQIGMGIAGAF